MDPRDDSSVRHEVPVSSPWAVVANSCASLARVSAKKPGGTGKERTGTLIRRNPSATHEVKPMAARIRLSSFLLSLTILPNLRTRMTLFSSGFAGLGRSR